jgi:ankyrin repeat protein
MSEVKFRDFILFMISNNVIGPGSIIGNEIYLWIKQHSDSRVLHHILSISGPTAEALSEQLASIAIENSDAEMLKQILDRGLDPRELRYRDHLLQLVTPLQRACYLMNFDVVRVLLDRGADVNGPTAEEASPLVIAIQSRHGRLVEDVIRLIQLLLDAGANVNEHGYSPLMAAASRREPELVKILLSVGADPNAQSESGTTPLMFAIREGERFPLNQNPSNIIPVLQLLLQAGACIDDEDYFGLTPLDKAAMGGNIDLVQFLLENGGCATEKALGRAARYRDVKATRLILQSGARVTQKVFEEIFENFTEDMSCEEDFTILRLLLKATKNIPRGELGGLALIAAIFCGETNMVHDLTSSVEWSDDVMLTLALGDAAERGEIETFRVLLNHDSPNRDFVIISLGTALHSSIRSEDDELTDFLLAAGADINAPDSEIGNTPLLRAVAMKDAALANRLLAAGASVNSKKLTRRLTEICGNMTSEYTASVLPAAVTWGDFVFIENLISMGADVNGIEPESGKTALTVPVERGDYETIQLLIAAGANINSPIPRFLGYSALAAAVRKNDIGTIRYLLTMGADPDEQSLISAIEKDREVLEVLFTAILKRYSRLPKGFGSRALQHAIKLSNSIAVEMLLSNGVDTKAIVRYHHIFDLASPGDSYAGEDGCSAFSTALAFDKSEGFGIVKAFLRAGANTDHIVREAPDWTALLVAINRNSPCLVQLLVAAGADVNLRVNPRVAPSPLQFAVELGNMEVIELLLEQCADVNAPPCNVRGATALQLASIYGHLGVVLALLERGAHVDAAPAKINGRTALEGASENGRIDILQVLLNTGAKLVGPGSAQYARARQRASKNGHIAVRRLLDAEHNKQQAESEAGGLAMTNSESDNVE